MFAFSKYLVFRIFISLLTLLAVSFLIYAIIEMMPGDYVDRYLFRKFASAGLMIYPEDVENARIHLGLDRPFIERYGSWVWGIVTRFDFGPAFRTVTPVTNILAMKFAATVIVVSCALTLTYLISIPLGMYSAVRQNTFADYSLTFIGYAGFCVPAFAVALILMVVNTFIFDVDVTGLISEKYVNQPWTLAKIKDFLAHAYIPMIVLGWASTAFALQTMRALMSDEVSKLYVTAAEARGIRGWKLYWQYPGRQAVVPMFNSIGYDLTRIFGDLPIIASILLMGELGQELIVAYMDADQNTAAAILVLLAASVTTINLITDVVIGVLDPRIRAGRFG